MGKPLKILLLTVYGFTMYIPTSYDTVLPVNKGRELKTINFAADL